MSLALMWLAWYCPPPRARTRDGRIAACPGNEEVTFQSLTCIQPAYVVGHGIPLAVVRCPTLATQVSYFVIVKNTQETEPIWFGKTHATRVVSKPLQVLRYLWR